ncbi:DUF998 domain-containing protein [Luteimonas abyssi]|uniref:DUF998 domain-containing protein n=1 Tax=Luteimonas abyssi TaxID=1247514 RepID=UPI000737B5BC|nr:DUF998 domain-containing protein [Luteimonas abyssi]
MTDPTHASPVLRAAVPVAGAGMALFATMAVVVHLLRPDLHWWDAQMSRYLLQPHGSWLQAAYCALAATIVAIALGVRATLAPAARSIGPLLLFVAGAAALVVTAFAPMDLDGVAPTFVGWLHGLSAHAAFLCTIVAMILQSVWMRRDPVWRRSAAAALAIAVAAFVAMWMLVLVQALPSGVSQKAVIAIVAAWFCLAWARLRAQLAVRQRTEALQ